MIFVLVIVIIIIEFLTGNVRKTGKYLVCKGNRRNISTTVL